MNRKERRWNLKDSEQTKRVNEKAKNVSLEIGGGPLSIPKTYSSKRKLKHV